MTAPQTTPAALWLWLGAKRRALFVLTCVVALTGTLGLLDTARSLSGGLPAPTRGVVDHVADGDTFSLTNGQRVRIVGIDSPEEYFGKHDCGSLPAAALLRRLLPDGTRVTLIRDAIQPNRDRYGRLLRYIATARNPDIGLAMIRSGWAGAYPYGAGNTREARYRLAAHTARARRLGGWAACHPLPPAYTHAGG